MKPPISVADAYDRAEREREAKEPDVVPEMQFVVTILQLQANMGKTRYEVTQRFDCTREQVIERAFQYLVTDPVCRVSIMRKRR